MYCLYIVHQAYFLDENSTFNYLQIYIFILWVSDPCIKRFLGTLLIQGFVNSQGVKIGSKIYQQLILYTYSIYFFKKKFSVQLHAYKSLSQINNIFYNDSIKISAFWQQYILIMCLQLNLKLMSELIFNVILQKKLKKFTLD